MEYHSVRSIEAEHGEAIRQAISRAEEEETKVEDVTRSGAQAKKQEIWDTAIRELNGRGCFGSPLDDLR